MELAFILVDPKRPENVGAAARALQTMGFKDLRLVGEPLQHSPKAQALAHGAQELLHNTRCFASLEQALEDIDLVIGSSAKTRHQRRYHCDPAALRDNLQAKQHSVRRAALLFGREEHGLTSAAIAQCDMLTQIPQAAPQPSLNLAQSVMVYSYCLSALDLEQTSNSPAQGQLQALRPKLQDLLLRAGVSEGEKSWSWVMERLAQTRDEDVKFLHFLCDKIERAANNMSPLDGNCDTDCNP